MRVFGEDERYVHLMWAMNTEYTVCGQAFDCGESEEDELHNGEIKTTYKKVVTCPGCIRAIENCRGVRIKKEIH